MKRIFLGMIFAYLCSACTQTSTLSTSCGGTSGYAATKITYGDSQISVNPKAFGKKKKELQFRLDPKSKSTDLIDYKDVVVTVTGKDSASSWITGSSSYNTSSEFFGGCVPDSAEPGDIYKYEIKVQHVGQLDPRVEVKL